MAKCITEDLYSEKMIAVFSLEYLNINYSVIGNIFDDSDILSNNKNFLTLYYGKKIIQIR